MNDFKFALRQLLRQPGFSLLAAFSLALGIGLVATQFSFVDAILLRGLSIPEAQRLVHISRLNPRTLDPNTWETVPYRDYFVFRDQQTVLETLGAVNQIGLNISGRDRIPSHHPGAKATANLLEVLGVQTKLGRWFTEEEDQPGQPLFIVLSHGLWQEQFGGDAAVLGASLTVNGEPGTIIGVMPPRFTFPYQQRLWVNLRATDDPPDERLADAVEMVGKLRPGTSLRQAAAEYNTIAGRLARMYPDTNRGYERMNLEKFARAYAGGGTEPVLYLMQAMTIFILALGSVNVANMLLGRASRRVRELALRAAIGASRWRLVRQLLLEALLIAGLGALGGLLLAQVGVAQLHHQFTEMNAPGWFDFRLDHRVLAVVVLVTLGAGVLAGILPALQAAGVDLNSALKEESRGASSLRLGRLSKWLVTAQIAFSSMLLVAACVLGWTVHQARQANLDYDPAQLLRGRIELHESTHPTPEDRARFFRQVLARLEAEPGVEAVAVSSRNFTDPGVQARVELEGAAYHHESDKPLAWFEVISADYFQLIRVNPVAGRLFDARDEFTAPRVALVNESFARQFWPESEPIGRRFRTSQTQHHWITVAGVVPDLQMQGLFAPADQNAAGFYLTQDQMGWGWLSLFLRTRGDPSTLIDPVRAAVAGLDPDQPVHSIGTLADQIARQIRPFTMVGTMAALFALITLFLGAVGVYGVSAFAVSRRTREFGIRMALGATLGSVLQLVLRQGARQILIGLGAGLTAAFFITRPMQGLFGQEPVRGPLVYILVSVLIALVGLLALWIPAWKAAHVDPMAALREE